MKRGIQTALDDVNGREVNGFVLRNDNNILIDIKDLKEKNGC